MASGVYTRTKPVWNKGKKRPPFSEEWKKKIKEGSKPYQVVKGQKLALGKHWKLTDVVRKTISKAGIMRWEDPIYREKMCKAFEKRDNKGRKSHFWKGGKSFESYTIDWTNTLKQCIRERDKYTCQICMEKQGDEALSVHHIDYDKKNCNPKNLIALCRKCHIKTNYNRKYWINYFNNL